MTENPMFCQRVKFIINKFDEKTEKYGGNKPNIMKPISCCWMQNSFLGSSYYLHDIFMKLHNKLIVLKFNQRPL